MNKPVNIIIVDDHAIFRDGLKSLIEEIDNFYIIGEAENGKQLLNILDKKQPDVVLMDISMPEMNGKECIKGLFNIDPNVKVIFSSGHDLTAESDELKALGCSGLQVKGFNANRRGARKLTVTSITGASP